MEKTNVMKSIISLIIFTVLGISGYAQTRNVLVGTNNAVVQPTNFWSGDASNARVGLGLGSAATNPETAFQKSSTVLSNLSLSNAINLTNIQGSNIVGIISASNIPAVTLTNINGTLGVSSGGTGASTASGARQNLGSTIVGDAVFTAANAAAARSAIGAMGSNSSASNLINFPAYLLTTNGNGFGLTNISISNIVGKIDYGSIISGSVPSTNISGSVLIVNGGTEATNAGGARTNLGLGAVWLTNTSVANFRNAISVASATNDEGVADFSLAIVDNDFAGNIARLYYDATGGDGWYINDAFGFRASLGLGWSALTNSNSGTSLVSVNSNGNVVSPTNFWELAENSTKIINIQPPTNFTTNILAARDLVINSLSASTINITNTIVFPTNGVLTGDRFSIVHRGQPSSGTVIKIAGDTNNLVVMNDINESIEFVYYNGQWNFNYNQSFTQPIYFSGTNQTLLAATSRTNLGVPSSFGSGGYSTTIIGGSGNSSAGFGSVSGGINNTASGAYSWAIGNGATASNANSFVWSSSGFSSLAANTFNVQASGGMSLDLGDQGISFRGNLSNVAKSVTRSNLGLGGTFLTNSNAANFRKSIGLGTDDTVLFGALVATNIFATNIFATNFYGSLIGGASTAAYIRDEANISTNPAMYWNSYVGWTVNDSGSFRAAIGMPLEALTNDTVAKFQQAIFTTNSAPSTGTNITGTNIAAWMGVNIVTNGVTNTFKIPLYK